VKTVTKKLSPSQAGLLKKFAAKVNKFGVNFAVCDGAGELILLSNGGQFESQNEELVESALSTLSEAAESGGAGREGEVFSYGERNQILTGMVGAYSGGAGFVVLIDLGEGVGTDQVSGDIKTEGLAPKAVFREMLSLLLEHLQAVCKAEEQTELVSSELSQTYEELVLLHKLSTNMKVTKADTNYLQMACDSLTDIVSVEGIAILLEKTVDDEKRLVLTAGSGLIDIDERMSSILHSRLQDEINSGKEALLDSEVDSPFRYEWPESVRNIIAVPLFGKGKSGICFGQGVEDASYALGLMVAVNRIDKPDFDSTDMKLFNSVANGCAVFIENGRLFTDLKELFIGSLKALTNSIDAKDPYTRGHSERVAFISRWIAERLAEDEALEEEQIHEVYLAGLLHDIGKMGIEESVLLKKGRLSREEFEHIKTHPSIGASILSEIKQMSNIVPGILYHHERVDGKGYPNGLKGEEIPLIGKIVGLADSFDAMTSKRVYRDAMTVEQAMAVIEKELGTQFDEKVGRAFLNSDVYHLWDIIQNGLTEIYGDNDSSKYGRAAIGTLIK